ncbi:TetR family transcriptional regulator [Streptomyces sp. NPDC060188]|uniref:TetR family transcriptional regulator n=1 Tax=Streptomyces sp. NPDC060188 TaxID=3347068 RepID=UPI003662E78E
MTRQERAVRTREALIEAAAQLFDRDGYEVTSLAAVTAKAQVSAGALYFHFATKADLADAVTHAALSRLRRIIDARTTTRPDAHDHVDAHAHAHAHGHAHGHGGGGGHGHGGGHEDEGEDGGGGAVARAAGGAKGERVAGSGSPASEPAPSPVSAPAPSPASAPGAVPVPSPVSAPGAVPVPGGGGGPVGVGELQQLIDTTHLFVRGLSRDVVLRAGFGLDGAWGERPVGEHAAEQGPVGRGSAGRRMGGEGPPGGWPHVGGGLRGVWSGWVHEVLSVAGARGVLASGVSARDAAVVVVAATVGFEVLGAQDPVWLAPDPLTGFWTLVLPALVPPPVRRVLQAGGSTAAH